LTTAGIGWSDSLKRRARSSRSRTGTSVSANTCSVVSALAGVGDGSGGSGLSFEAGVGVTTGTASRTGTGVIVAVGVSAADRPDAWLVDVGCVRTTVVISPRSDHMVERKMAAPASAQASKKRPTKRRTGAYLLLFCIDHIYQFLTHSATMIVSPAATSVDTATASESGSNSLHWASKPAVAH
jgi:hypothetical protein